MVFLVATLVVRWSHNVLGASGAVEKPNPPTVCHNNIGFVGVRDCGTTTKVRVAPVVFVRRGSKGV